MRSCWKPRQYPSYIRESFTKGLIYDLYRPIGFINVFKFWTKYRYMPDWIFYTTDVIAKSPKTFTLHVLTVKMPQRMTVEQAVTARPVVHSVCVSPPRLKGNTHGLPASGPPTVSHKGSGPASRGHEVTEQSPQLLKTTLPAGSTWVAHQWAPFPESCL